MSIKDVHNRIEQVPSGLILKASLCASLAERLTRETCTQNIKRRDGRRINFPYISTNFFFFSMIIEPICFFTFFIDLSCHDAFAAEISHGLMKPANPSKQINESKSRFGWCIFTGSLIFRLFCIFWDIPSIALTYGTLNSTFLAKHCNPSYRNAPFESNLFCRQKHIIHSPYLNPHL